jgi:hypothetical protein
MSGEIIRVYPERIYGWGIGPGGMYRRDVG